jgi:hypothetical protein
MTARAPPSSSLLKVLGRADALIFEGEAVGGSRLPLETIKEKGAALRRQA